MNPASITILVIDKKGEIAPFLIDELKEHNVSVVYVGEGGIPFRKIPKIPNTSYTHIFVIYSKEVERLGILPRCLKKAEEDKAKLIFVCEKNSIDNELIESVTSFKNAYVVVYGGVLNYFLHQVKKTQKIIIYQSGISHIYSVLLEDIKRELLKVAFEKVSNKIFFLFPKHPPTELSLARLIHKIDPTVGIDFSIKENAQTTKGKALDLSQNGEYLLSEKYPEVSDIKKAYWENAKTPSLLFTEKKESQRPYLFYAVLFLFALLMLPIITMTTFGLLGEHMLLSAKNEMQKGNITSARKISSYSNLFFTIAQNSAKGVGFEISLVGREDLIQEADATIDAGKELSKALVYALDAFQMVSSIVDGKSKNPKEDIMYSVNLAKSAIGIFQKIRAENSKLFTSMNSFDTTIDLFANTIDVFPVILGFEEKKTYLVLFQNNMELRPGGGFIGSYGLLTLKNGKVEDFSIYDVYDADGELKGHIDPPYPIRRYLPSEHWYLRDSNFDVDFQRGASTSAYFLKLETGSSVDGVIGVDISFVENILKATGSIYVPDYNETVSSNNLYMLTQSHVEKNFFPGSSQKKDFLRSLFTSLKLNVENKKHLSYLTLGKSIEDSISQKHILFSFADSRLQSLFTVNGISSSLWDNRLENKTKINDFLGVFDANLGVNKANFFIKRKIRQEVTVESSIVSSKLTIAYKNTSASWPGGDYKNYLRIVVPFGSRLSSISIDGKEQKIEKAITDPLLYEAKKFIPPSGLEVEETQDSGKTIFGFLSIVPADTTKTIEISYMFPHSVSEEQTFSYDHKLFKQPGTLADRFMFSLSFPSTFKVVNGQQSIKKEENKVEWKHDLSSDYNFSIHFSRK